MANNKIAFGLCKQYNIELPKAATPHDAWEALKKRGIAYGDDGGRSGTIIPNAGKPHNTEQLRDEFDINALTAEMEADTSNATQILRRAIDCGKVNLRIHRGRQEKHISGTQNYRQELEKGKDPSILTADPNELIKIHAGNGVSLFKKGKWIQAERFLHDSVIGLYKNKRYGQTFPTKCGRIHYSNRGAHIVPDKENNNEKNR